MRLFLYQDQLIKGYLYQRTGNPSKDTERWGRKKKAKKSEPRAERKNRVNK